MAVYAHAERRERHRRARPYRGAVASIRVQGEDVVVECGEDETLLAALHRTGHAVISGCRRGGCGVCKVDLVDGEVEYTRTVAPTVLSPEDRAAGVCLTCRAVPRGDVTVALRPDDRGRTNPVFALYLDAVRRAGGSPS